MTKKSTPAQPIINRTPGSETKHPAIAIAATPAGYETVYLGELKSVDGKLAHLRVGRMGYRVLLENKRGTWHTVHNHQNTQGTSLGTGALARLDELHTTLPALGFTPDEASIDLIDSLPGNPSAVYTAVRDQRSIVPADYLPADVQALRDYTAGASQFRGF